MARGGGEYRPGESLVARRTESWNGKTWLGPKQVVIHRLYSLQHVALQFLNYISTMTQMTHDENMKEECGSVHRCPYCPHSNPFRHFLSPFSQVKMSQRKISYRKISQRKISQMKMHIFNSRFFPDWDQLCTVLTGWKLPMHPSLPKLRRTYPAKSEIGGSKQENNWSPVDFHISN